MRLKGPRCVQVIEPFSTVTISVAAASVAAACVLVVRSVIPSGILLLPLLHYPLPTTHYPLRSPPRTPNDQADHPPLSRPLHLRRLCPESSRPASPSPAPNRPGGLHRLGSAASRRAPQDHHSPTSPRPTPPKPSTTAPMSSPAPSRPGPSPLPASASRSTPAVTPRRSSAPPRAST